eukprot:scaffold1512_cov219-Skeletonema_marinoi.AAC.2
MGNDAHSAKDDRCSVTYSGSGRMIPLLLITKYSEMNMMYEYGMRKADAFVPRHMHLLEETRIMLSLFSET